MGKLRFTFTNIFYLVGLILSVFLFENITFFSNSDPDSFYKVGMETPYFFLFFSLALLSYIFLIIYESVFNKAVVNVKILVACLLLFVTGTIGTILLSDMSFTNGSPDFLIDDFTKLKQIFVHLLLCLTIYSTFFYFSKNHPSIKRIVVILVIVVLATYFLILYSIFTEMGKYHDIAYGIAVTKRLNIHSVFQNSNMFSGMILLGMGASIAINYFKKNVFSYISIAFFFTIQQFVFSKTGVIVTFAMVVLYFLLECIANFVKNRKSAYIRLAIYVVSVITAIVLFSISQTAQIPLISPVSRYVYERLQTADFQTFTQRTRIWEASFGLLSSNTNAFIFGFGHDNVAYIVGRAIHSTGYKMSCHNAFIQIFMEYGVVGISLYALIFIGFIYCILRTLKKDVRFGLIFGMIGLVYIGEGFTETISAFYPSAQGILIGVLFYLPVFNKYTHIRKTEFATNLIEDHSAPSILSPKLMVKFMGRFILCLICLVGIFFAFDEIRAKESICYALINAEVILGVFYFTFPYLSGIWAKEKDLLKYILNFLACVLPIVLLSGGLCAVNYLYRDSLASGFYWIIPAAIIVVLLIEVVGYTIMRGGSIKIYVHTFTTLLTSIGSLIGFGILFSITWYVKDTLIAKSIVTYALFAVAALLFFTGFTYIVPFKDLIEIDTFVNEFDANQLKKDVIRDRLEGSYGF